MRNLCDISRGLRKDNENIGTEPSLVILAAGMLLHAVLALEPFGAFHAIPLPKAGEILCWLGGFVLG